MRTGHLTCVDESRSRLRRLRTIIESYMPKSYLDESIVRLVHGNGVTFVADEEARGHSFDRVNHSWCVCVSSRQK